MNHWKQYTDEGIINQTVSDVVASTKETAATTKENVKKGNEHVAKITKQK